MTSLMKIGNLTRANQLATDLNAARDVKEWLSTTSDATCAKREAFRMRVEFDAGRQIKAVHLPYDDAYELVDGLITLYECKLRTLGVDPSTA